MAARPSCSIGSDLGLQDGKTRAPVSQVGHHLGSAPAVLLVQPHNESFVMHEGA